MTLSQIIRMALRQLDEDPGDVSEYDDLFRAYANIGYHIAVREYLHPREVRTLHTDECGAAPIGQTDIVRVVDVRRKVEDGGPLYSVPFALTGDGRAVKTRCGEETLYALCEVDYPAMSEETEEPKLPENVHHALADYICYRHLSSGNLAKQSRAQFYLSSFYQAMRQMKPDGFGSVTHEVNLYAVTDIRA